ncbi:MAG: hypothetical protein A2Z15_02700 [Chloroflexi bacterium RBG_16_50_11]|nr:MAG: hypothetical protein A2Z15_02700 [Chloroflexi bacterium RBG_16_50_11]
MACIFKSCPRLLPLALIIAFIFSIIGPNTALANPGWYDFNWQYRKKITINAANVTATLTNFPVLISITSDTDLAADAQDDGDDILFTAADEVTKLSHEIESFNGTSGKLVAWVKIPSLSSVTNTDIYMYYGNAGAANQQNAASVWNSDFKMVQHLEETAGGVNAITDSTANGNHGTDNNTPTFGATGRIDGAITLTKASSEYIQLPASNQILSTGNFTIEAWFNTSTNHPAYGIGTMEGRIVNFHHSAVSGTTVSLYVEQDMIGLLYYTGSAYVWVKYTVNYHDSVYHHIAVTYNSSTYRLYYDGVQVASSANTSGGFGTFPAFIGAHNTAAGQRFFDGTVDEVRVSSAPYSADWIKTGYNNQNNPASFFSLGPEQNAFVTPTVTTNNATLVEETTTTLNGYLNSDGGEACQYSFEWGTAPSTYTANISWTGSITTGQTFSTNLIGLTKGQPYYYRAKVKNSAGIAYGGEIHFLTKPDGPVVLTATTNSSSRIDLSWTKGDGANRTMIRRATGTYPATYNDGTQVYFDTGTSYSNTGLSGNVTYYYRAWSEVTGSQQWSDTFVSASATTFAGPPTVIGGKVFSVNKAAVLAPWLIMATTFMIILFSVVLHIRQKTPPRPPKKNLKQ